MLYLIGGKVFLFENGGARLILIEEGRFECFWKVFLEKY